MKILLTLFRASLWSLLCCISAAVLIFASSILYLSPNLPDVEKLREVRLQIPLRVYTSDFKLISEFGEQRRTPLTFEQIPPIFVKAILAAEDDRFYQHHGVDITGLTRAALELIATGSIRTGGSTITMQVAKNFFLSTERTFIRKFNEILLALQIERELTKSEILELYINKIYLGHRAYGIAAAAQVYYGKNIDELNLAQLAMIAGLPKAPSSYNPITNPARALVRRNWILQRMLRLDYIDQAAYKESSTELTSESYHGAQPEVDAMYLAEMVRKEMVDRYGNQAYTDGYTVITTVNSVTQNYANDAVQQGLQNYDMRHGYRGPEAKASLAALANPIEKELNKNILDNISINEWSAALKNYQTIGPLLPGIVTSVREEKATVVLKDQRQIELNLESISWARPYVTVDHIGPKPKLMSDTLAEGDIIRVQLAPIRPAKSKPSQNDELPVNEDASEDTIEEPPTQWLLSQLPEAQAALIALNPDNGAIEAIVGGFDFYQSKFNRVTQAGRQAGSNFKPFIYTAALAHGFTAASIINDAPIVFDENGLENAWRPVNSGGKFYGPTRLREALYRSQNLVSIRLLQKLGINRALDYTTRFGFDASKLPKNLSLALGSGEVTPIEVATGYTAFANGGYKVSPYFINSISDFNSNVIYKADPAIVCDSCESQATAHDTEQPQESNAEEITNQTTHSISANNFDAHQLETDKKNNREAMSADELAAEELFLLDSGLIDDTTVKAEPSTSTSRINSTSRNNAKRTIDPRDIFVINSMLQDVITRGTGQRARSLGRNDLAGKTGTTNDQKDAWFTGYNPDLVVTTWLGFDSPESLGANEYGGTAALPIWIQFMEKALKGKPERKVRQPDRLVTVKIDPDTGERAPPGQGNAIFEFFREEYAPKNVTAINNKSQFGSPENTSTIEELF